MILLIFLDEVPYMFIVALKHSPYLYKFVFRLDNSIWLLFYIKGNTISYILNLLLLNFINWSANVLTNYLEFIAWESKITQNHMNPST